MDRLPDEVGLESLWTMIVGRRRWDESRERWRSGDPAAEVSEGLETLEQR